MQIRHVLIKNFRGIRQLSWTIYSPIVCLVGAGDATKSTILDAIDFTLSPKWNLTFEDCDFYLENTDEPIEIIVTIGQIPGDLLKQEKFGLEIRGWNEKDGIHDEPQGDDEHVLSIRLIVEKSLEPQWTVVNDRNLEGHTISSKEREKLGMSRLGTYIDKHLYWGQGSALSSLTTDRKENAAPIIMDAHRKAREAAKIEDIEEFKSAVAQTEQIAKEVGYKPKASLRPALDPRAINIGLGAIAIHDGNIPLRLSGLGSRRLLALGIQLYCVAVGSPLLIDEIEYGLEPHRIRHLLNYLQNIVNNRPNEAGQVIMTSHSATVVVELSAASICVVRSKNGETIIRNVPNDLQGTIRKVPDSLLGLRVVVCEGKTELGILRSVEDYWINNKSRTPMSYNGVVLVEGGGDDAPKRAYELAMLGYATCLFIDGDKIKSLKPDIKTLTDSGISIFHWSNAFSTEQQVAMDLSWDALKEIVDLGSQLRGEDSVYQIISNNLGKEIQEIGKNIDEWRENGIAENDIRIAIGNAAKQKDKEWFKRIDFGEELGSVIIKDIPNIAGKEIVVVLDKIEGWIYE